MKKCAFIMVILSCVMAVAAHGQQPPQQETTKKIAPLEDNYVYRKLEVPVGGADLVRFDVELSDIFVADSAIADVTANSAYSFYVQGRNPGRTTIIGYNESGGMSVLFDVHVMIDPEKLKSIIASFEPDINVDVLSTPRGILMRGLVDSSEQADFVNRLATQYINSILGTEPSDELNFNPYLINQLRVNAPSQVNLQVRIAEVSRNVSEYISINLGLENLGSTVFGGAVGRRGLGSGVVNFDRGSTPGGSVAESFALLLTKPWGTLYTVLDLLEQDGYLTTLAQPNLTALSGETASFLAGGEIPVPQAGQIGASSGGVGAATVIFRPFGVALEFTPVILSGGRISIEIEAEVSDVDESSSVVTPLGFSIPRLATRRAKTTVEVASGQNFAIAGLLQNSIVNSTRQVPGLGDIPIIGALFRSDEFSNNETELVIIVTPLLVEPTSEQVLKTPVERFSFNNQLERWLTGNILNYKSADLPTEDIVMAPRYLEIGGFMLE